MRQMLLAAIFTLATAPALYAAGLLRPVDASYQDMEIKEHKVRAVINNGFARTEVDQIFHNPNPKDLEARYTFPVPERASMSELSLWIDGKEIQGEVLAKQKARQVYETEKAQGRSTALNEKKGYRAFEVSVSPVRAGKDTRVRLVYYQPLDVDHNIGRYVYPLEDGGTDDAQQTAFFLNDVVTGEASFAVDVTLKTSYPLEAVMVPSHPEAKVIRRENGGYRVSIHKPGPAALRRDFVLNYRLAQDRPAGVELIPFKEAGAEEGTFMVVLTPGEDLQAIRRGSDWTFVLDISGSMQNKIASLSEGVEKAISKMRPNDRFRIALFNQQAQWLIKPFTVANRENIAKATRMVRGLQANGGTNLYAGLALGLEKLDGDRTNGVLLVTDGVANNGITDPKKMLKLLRGTDLRLFTFVMGNGANRPLLRDLARATNGFAANVSNADAIIGQILLAKSKLTHEAMHGVEVSLDGAKVHSLTPAKPLTLYRGDQLVLFGKYRGEGDGKLTLQAKISGKPVKRAIPIAFPKEDTRHPEIERLWAFSKIRELEMEKRFGGNAREIESAVTDIALQYSLVTDYTSMIVLDDAGYERHSIRRDNQARVKRERAAQTARAQAPAARPNKRYNYSSGASKKGFSVPSLGGGGCAGPFLGLFSALLARRRRGKRK